MDSFIFINTKNHKLTNKSTIQLVWSAECGAKEDFQRAENQK